MSFTDQKQRIATEKDCSRRWGFGKPGEKFKCYLCGHKFEIGDKWRWVYSTVFSNFLVCDTCDGDDVLERWKKHIERFRKAYWWAN